MLHMSDAQKLQDRFPVTLVNNWSVKFTANIKSPITTVEKETNEDD